MAIRSQIALRRQKTEMQPAVYQKSALTFQSAIVWFALVCLTAPIYAQETWVLTIKHMENLNPAVGAGSIDSPSIRNRINIRASGSVTLREGSNGLYTYTGTGRLSVSKTATSFWSPSYRTYSQCSADQILTASAYREGVNLIIRVEANRTQCKAIGTRSWWPGTETVETELINRHWYVVIKRKDKATAETKWNSAFGSATSQFTLSGKVDWCEEAKNIGLDWTAAGHSAAGVICAEGKAIPCVWENSVIPEIDECALEHEQSHIKDIKCPQVSSFKTSLFPKRPKTSTRSLAAECTAYTRQLSCLTGKRSICTKPGVTTKQCQREFDFSIGSVRAEMKTNRCH